MTYEGDAGLPAPGDGMVAAATAHLVSVARCDCAGPGVALHCLAAVELLRGVAASPGPRGERATASARLTTSAAVSDAAAIGVALRAACAQLAGLPADVFARTPVANAAAHARRALELLDGG